MILKFRPLNASEIECRVSTINENGCTLLLYKDARVDQNLLDEVVGPMNWQRSHNRDNANCVVSIWDSDKNQWISKEDTGTESFTEKEKGLASDSFKRACFNWGIGRELYTAPFIFIKAGRYDTKTGCNGKLQVDGRFVVYDIVTDVVDENGVCKVIKKILLTYKNEIVFQRGYTEGELKAFGLKVRSSTANAAQNKPAASNSSSGGANAWKTKVNSGNGTNTNNSGGSTNANNGGGASVWQNKANNSGNSNGTGNGGNNSNQTQQTTSGASVWTQNQKK